MTVVKSIGQFFWKIFKAIFVRKKGCLKEGRKTRLSITFNHNSITINKGDKNAFVN